MREKRAEEEKRALKNTTERVNEAALLKDDIDQIHIKANAVTQQSTAQGVETK